MGRSMMEGTSTDSFQMFTGKKNSQTPLINNWSFVFMIVLKPGLGGRRSKHGLCCLVCLVTEDKPWLPLVSCVTEKGNSTAEVGSQKRCFVETEEQYLNPLSNLVQASAACIILKPHCVCTSVRKSCITDLKSIRAFRIFVTVGYCEPAAQMNRILCTLRKFLTHDSTRQRGNHDHVWQMLARCWNWKMYRISSMSIRNFFISKWKCVQPTAAFSTFETQGERASKKIAWIPTRTRVTFSSWPWPLWRGQQKRGFPHGKQ